MNEEKILPGSLVLWNHVCVYFCAAKCPGTPTDNGKSFGYPECGQFAILLVHEKTVFWSFERGDDQVVA